MKPGRVVGRYALYDKLAAGGMATIHVACTLGAVGFSRVVVVKRLHTKLATERGLVAMFVDEARIASRVRHPNVIPMLDVVAEDGELFLVMEYAHGESLARLVAKAATDGGAEIPLSIVSAVGVGMLEGLHAAHEATSERGEPLALVHRDVSPQNVIVGVDGIARVFDFGVAKAAVRIYETDDGTLRGKCAYMSPEQITNRPIDRRTDIWAAGVVLWEMVTRRRLFVCGQLADYIDAIAKAPIPPPSEYASTPAAFDRVIAKALERDPARRYATAREFATALEEAVAPSNPRTIGDWVQSLAAEAITHRAELVKRIEQATNDPETARRELAQLELGSAPAVGDDDDAEPPASSDMPTTTVPHTTTLAVQTAPLPGWPPVVTTRLPASAPAAPDQASAPRSRLLLAGVVLAIAGGVIAAAMVVQRGRSHDPPAAATLVPSGATALPVAVADPAPPAPETLEVKSQALSSALSTTPGPAPSPLVRRPAAASARPRPLEPIGPHGIDWNSRK